MEGEARGGEQLVTRMKGEWERGVYWARGQVWLLRVAYWFCN